MTRARRSRWFWVALAAVGVAAPLGVAGIARYAAGPSPASAQAARPVVPVGRAPAAEAAAPEGRAQAPAPATAEADEAREAPEPQVAPPGPLEAPRAWELDAVVAAWLVLGELFGFTPAQAAVGPLLVASGLPSLTYAAAPPSDERLFLLERQGRIRILEGGAVRATPFLDIRTRVGGAGEGGLLGMAFDPDHALNGLFYTYYTNTQGASIVSRFQLGADPNVADAATEEILLTVGQPFANHNGGTIAFSPMDGHNLYVALGDGGSANDPNELAQNPGNLLGKMLRLDVSGGAGMPYAIPPDNPFVGSLTVREEIWALGLRNPFRFSFDSATGDLWIGDVGQGAREEVDFEAAISAGGLNWGWDVMEGTLNSASDFAAPPYVNAPPFAAPIYQYSHAGGRCSITGGIVYRGTHPAIQDEYVFADWCTGEIWGLDPSTLPPTVTNRTAEIAPPNIPQQLVALVEGGFGALHLVLLNGSVYRVGETGEECSDGIDNDGDGQADFGNDTGCSAADDPSERDVDVACDDGYDNDRDGDIDFPADRFCASAAAQLEASAGPGGGGNGGNDGNGCGLGFELVLILPAWRALRRRLRLRG